MERDPETSTGAAPGKPDPAFALKRARRSVPPQVSRASQHTAEQQRMSRREREGVERRSILRGLILLAALAVLFAVLHGGAGRAFPAGWWRQW